MRTATEMHIPDEIFIRLPSLQQISSFFAAFLPLHILNCLLEREQFHGLSGGMARHLQENSTQHHDSNELRVTANTERVSAIGVANGELPNRVNIDSN
jgi:hypothetical protein